MNAWRTATALRGRSEKSAAEQPDQHVKKQGLAFQRADKVSAPI